MPKRSTDRQKAIYLLRKAIAPEGWRVEESVELYDPVLDETREVDVVVYGQVNELNVVISFEVTDRGRAADVLWVESMLAKHEHLPTSKLVLVSWKGFTKTAKVKASSRPDVVLMAPITGHGDPRTMTLYADEITATLDRIVIHVETPSGETRRIRAEPDYEFRDFDGKGVAALDYIMMLFELREIPRRLLERAHNSDNRDDLRYFTMGWVAGDGAGEQFVHLFETDTGELHRIVSGEVTGPFKWQQKAVDLRIARFKDIVFGHGMVTLHGRDGHIVLTLQEGEAGTRGAIELTTSPPEDHHGHNVCDPCEAAPREPTFPELRSAFPSTN